jgi:AraC-like DNA-binding protein
MKKANLEKIEPAEGSSFHMAYNKAPLLCHQDFWHFHPEFEIVYVPHGKGKRFVGDRISEFTDGDLVLLGPNIPHNAFNFGFESAGYEEYVIQFRSEHIAEMTDSFPEFSRIARLLAGAETGIAVTGEAKHRIGSLIKEMYRMNSFFRLMQLFFVLREMSLLPQVEDLEAKKFLSVDAVHVRRIGMVYQIIQRDYQQELSTRQVADELAMTESSFCRWFRHTTGKTFKQALTEMRIQKACALLTHSDQSIASVASMAGFNNISLFNRFFKDIVQMTPNRYRKSIGVKMTIACLFLVFLLSQLLTAQTVLGQLPVIKASSKKVSINDGGYLDKDVWNLNPKFRPDVYTADRTRQAKWVTFYTDIDSIRVKVKRGTKFDFIILLNGTDSCYTRIASAIPSVNAAPADVVAEDTIPFELTAYNAIKVRALINDKDTLNLHFDVGSFSIHTIKKLDKVYKLQMGTMILNNPEIGHTALTAHDMDGRFGWDLFEGRQVEIDYDRGLLIIHSKSPRGLKSYARMPLQFIRSYVCIKGSFKKENKVYSGDFMLDTGSDQAVIVDSVWASRGDFPRDLPLLRSTVLKDPRGAQYKTRVVLAPKMKIAKFELDSVPTMVLGSLNPTHMKLNLLGNDLLKRFNIILDFQHDYLYLKPNKLMGVRYREQS